MFYVRLIYVIYIPGFINFTYSGMRSFCIEFYRYNSLAIVIYISMVIKLNTMLIK